MSAFAELGLSEQALAAVETLGYTEPTPVQEQAIPLALEGRDVIAAAKTGTGKTAAFALPCMDTLPHRERNERGPLMLVITPTRELASQIGDTCMPIGKHTGHFVAMFLGGVSYDPQIKKLERGIDVAIATPGRLIDLMERGAADLSSVRVLVIDEADRMLDMGFWPQVDRIVKATPEDRQTLLFSATIDRSQDQVMFSLLNDPAIVEIAHRGETADKVTQYVIHTTRREKPQLLNSFIKEKGGTRVIVFTKTKGGADNCARRLRRIGIPTGVIHADRTQAQRMRALNEFKSGASNVIVATDVLARGIDVPEVDYVVNYDLPIMPEDYVHRIGRTGRAGADGFAVSLVTPDTKNLLRNIQKFIGTEIDEMAFEAAPDAFDPIDNADPRMIAQAEREAAEKQEGKRAEREGERHGSSRPEGAKGKRKKPRARDIERAQEHKKKLEAEAAGIEYVPPARPHEKKERKPTIAERQAAAEAAFNALFDTPAPVRAEEREPERGTDRAERGRGAKADLRPGRAARSERAAREGGRADRAAKHGPKGARSERGEGGSPKDFGMARGARRERGWEFKDERKRSRKEARERAEERGGRGKGGSRGFERKGAQAAERGFDRRGERDFEDRRPYGESPDFDREAFERRYARPEEGRGFFDSESYRSGNVSHDKRGKKYSGKQYSDGRGARPGKKAQSARPSHAGKGSAGSRAGAKGAGFSGEKRSGAKGFGGKRQDAAAQSERGFRASGRGDSRPAPGRGFRSAGGHAGGKGGFGRAGRSGGSGSRSAGRPSKGKGGKRR